MPSGLIFNIQRYSLHDGPGIRTTVFLKGCPLDCWWCHNPESQDPAAQVVVMENRCLHCGSCEAVCPLGTATHDITRRGECCTLCERCVEACPSEARQTVGRVMTGEQVFDQIARDQMFYEQSGGGVTFSGGEPLMRFAFLQELLARCRDRGIHTAVDTCGYAPWDHFAAIVPITNLFLFDIKMMDDARHKEVTGVSNVRILDNLRQLSEQHATIWVRIPLIPGVNDSPENLAATADFVAKLPGRHPVNLLPYHQTGLHKFSRVGQACRMGATRPHEREHLESAMEHFRCKGLTTTLMS